MPIPAIEFRGVSFARPGQAQVLDDFTLTVGAGEVLALVGRSGAGKSTLLKLVNRLLLPDAGAVVVEGRSTREWEPIALRRRVGYVLQDVGLFPHMSVADNVAVVIPPGVAHAIRTESSEDLIMVYGTSTTFRPEFEGRIAADVELAPLPESWQKFLG